MAMEREVTSLRAKNAALMKSNLSALMSVREADADAGDLLAALRGQCAALERAGITIPERCRELLEQHEDASAAATSRVEGGDRHTDHDRSAVDTERQSATPGVDVDSADSAL